MYLTSQTSIYRGGWDRAGIGASLLCVLHCLLTPLLVTALPVLAVMEEGTHRALALAILLFGMLAFIPGYRKHAKASIPAGGSLGMGLIVLAALLPEMRNAEAVETVLVLTGGVTLMAAHLRNAWWCRYCDRCRETTCGLSESERGTTTP